MVADEPSCKSIMITKLHRALPPELVVKVEIVGFSNGRRSSKRFNRNYTRRVFILRLGHVSESSHQLVGCFRNTRVSHVRPKPCGLLRSTIRVPFASGNCEGLRETAKETEDEDENESNAATSPQHCRLYAAPTVSPLCYYVMAMSKDGQSVVLVSSSDLDFDKAEPAFKVP